MEKIALGGFGKVLALAGAGAAGYGIPKLYNKFAGGQKPDTFDEEEKRLFARHGIDPKALGFYKTLGNLMRGMKMQNQFMEMAMQGRPERLPGQPLDSGFGQTPSRLDTFA